MKWISGLLILALAALLVFLCVAPNVQEEMLASKRNLKWAKYWQAGHASAELKMDGDLLPTQLTGPADQWAGAREHSLEIDFSAEPGSYEIEMQFYDAHESAPPKLVFRLNGRAVYAARLRPGRGWPAPYRKINRGMTVRFPIVVAQKQNRLSVVDAAGSWAAPAKIRLIQGHVLNPAKAAYLLLARKSYFALAALLLLAAVFFWAAGKSGVKNAAFAVVLVTVSSLIAFVVVEVGFREYLIRFPQARQLAAKKAETAVVEKGKQYGLIEIIEPNPDPEILYRPKPNLDGYFGTAVLKTNSHGMRGPEVSLAKPPGVIRVAGLGDSVMFGWGLPIEDSALSQLGEMLEKKYQRPVQALNFGCPSYNTAVEVTIYRKIARRFHPDLAILLFVMNDFNMPSLRIEPVQRFTLRKSYIWEQLRRRAAVYWDDSVYERERIFMSRHHLGPMTDQEQKELDEWGKELDRHFKSMTGKRAVAAYLKQWADMLREDGIKGVFIYEHYTVIQPTEDVAYVLKAARSYGLEVLDMTPFYAAWLKEHHQRRLRDVLWRTHNDSHPNRERNRIIARAVLDLVAKKNLLAAALKP